MSAKKLYHNVPLIPINTGTLETASNRIANVGRIGNTRKKWNNQDNSEDYKILREGWRIEEDSCQSIVGEYQILLL